jgi:pimeloyl-ACP methyl ester carboxylesterase
MSTTTDVPGVRAIPLQPIAFGRFTLDRDNELLTRDGQPVRLRPKTFAMLAHLVAAAGHVVTKQDLLETLWPDVFVGDAALKSCMREIREALGDDARQPGFIETAHRRGYRFIASLDRRSAAQTVEHGAAPRTLYARNGDANIAYQVSGSGPVDVIMTTGWVSHLDYMWTEPRYAAFLTRIASFARLIVYDARGTGLSDQLPDRPSPDLCVGDLHAVMEASGSRRAVLLGVSDGGPVCSLFAARHAERTNALIVIGGYASARSACDYPWGDKRQRHEAFVAQILDDWGGPFGVDDWAPSAAPDARFRAWWSTYLRMGASPAAAAALARHNGCVDVRDALGAIEAPTLIVHRKGDRIRPVAGARYMARRIRSATLVELPGEDHLPFVGDRDAIADEVERFVRPFRR